MENYENLRQRRHEIKSRMDELGQAESTHKRIEGYLGDVCVQSQETLEYSLRSYTGFFGSKNGFTLQEDLTDKDLQDRVVEAAVLKILKKEIRSRQIESRKAKLSQRLYR